MDACPVISGIRKFQRPFCLHDLGQRNIQVFAKQTTASFCGVSDYALRFVFEPNKHYHCIVLRNSKHTILCDTGSSARASVILIPIVIPTRVA